MSDWKEGKETVMAELNRMDVREGKWVNAEGARADLRWRW